MGRKRGGSPNPFVCRYQPRATVPSRFPPRRPPLPRWAGSAAPPPLPGPGSSLAPGLSSSSSPNSPPPLCLFFLFPLPLSLLSVRLSARGTASNAGSLPYGAPPGLEGPPAPAAQPPSTQPRRRCAGADPALSPAASPRHRTPSFSSPFSSSPQPIVPGSGIAQARPR